MRAGLLVLASLLLTACGGTAPAGRPAALAVHVEPIARLQQPGGVAFGFGSVWAADPAGHVLRLDPEGHVLARIGVPNEGLVYAGAGSVWLPDFGADRVRRIDPATNRVAARIRTGAGPAYLAVDGTGAWVSLHHGNRVERIEGDRVVTRLRGARADIERGGPQGVARAAGRVWTGVPVLKQVIPVQPSGPPVATTQEPCGTIAAAGEQLWVSPGMCGYRLMRIDARRGRQVGEIQLSDANVGDPAVSGATLWVTTADGLLHRLDARTGRRLGRARLGGEFPSLAVAAPDRLFAAGRDVVRIDVRSR